MPDQVTRCDGVFGGRNDRTVVKPSGFEARIGCAFAGAVQADGGFQKRTVGKHRRSVAVRLHGTSLCTRQEVVSQRPWLYRRTLSLDDGYAAASALQCLYREPAGSRGHACQAHRAVA